MEHARRQLAAHALPERQVAHGHVEEIRRLEQLGELADARPLARRVEPVDRRQHPVRLARCELEPQLRPLAEQRADARRQPLAVLPGHHAEHGGVARGRVQDPGQDLDRRRLPGAVRADVGDALTGLNAEGDVAHGLDRPSRPPPP